MVIRAPRPRASSASAETFSSRRVRVLIAYGAGLRWRPVATVVGELGVAVVVLLLLPAFPFKQLLIGFMLGSITMAVTLSIGQVDDPLVHGRWAEQWSVEALRKVNGWRVIDNVPFDHVDVDHVAVTPCGVLAVETKFHSKLSAGLAADVHARDLAAARAAAAKLRLLLRSFKLPDDRSYARAHRLGLGSSRTAQRLRPRRRRGHPGRAPPSIVDPSVQRPDPVRRDPPAYPRTPRHLRRSAVRLRSTPPPVTQAHHVHRLP